MTKAQLKYFQSLSQLKNRKAEAKYLVEGSKSVVEWLSDGRFVDTLIATEAWLQENELLAKAYKNQTIVSLQHEIDKVSALTTPTPVLLIASMPPNTATKLSENNWALALDGIRDPGNMGTIIRIADWYGIKNLLLSADCVEVYNPKVVQASMGSLLRISISVHDKLHEALAATTLPKYITHLQGKNIQTFQGAAPGIIVIGNESNGVSELVVHTASETVLIPKIGGAESLNAAVATGIVCHSLIMN